MIGTGFFKNHENGAFTMDGESDNYMINNFLRLTLCKTGDHNRPGFQQDNDTCHTVRQKMGNLH